jgi:hypothetical protein
VPLTIGVDYTRVSGLEIGSSSTSATAATILYGGDADHVLLEGLIIYTDGTSGNGVLIPDTRTVPNLHISNTIFFGGGANPIQCDMSAAGVANRTINLDHVTSYRTSQRFLNCPQAGGDATGGGTGDLTINAYNCAFGGATTDTFRVLNPAGSNNLNGSHNARTVTMVSGITDNTTNEQNATGGMTDVDTTASAIIVASLTDTSEDLTLVDATGGGSNLAIDNGTNRIGSEPDARQDFSIDVSGAVRGATGVDIGAFVEGVSVPDTVAPAEHADVVVATYDATAITSVSNAEHASVTATAYDASAITTATLTQEGSRWRNDDGNEITATWAAAQHAPSAVAAGVIVRLRVLVDAEGNPDPAAFTLQGREVGDVIWTTIPV